MRVLLTADPFLPVPPTLYGGIERVIAQLADELLQLGHDVGLLAHPDSTAPTERFGWADTRPAGSLAHWRNGRALAKAARDFQPDLVHSFSRLAYLMQAGHSGSMRAVPSLMCYQREPTGRTISLASRWLGERLRFSGCSGYIASRGRASAGTWHAVHNCVRCADYDWSDRVGADAPLVFLSRVESIKGAHLAIQIARESGRRLLIAGNHAEEGPERRYFDSQVKAECDEQIEYIGPVNDEQKQALLTQAAAMVVPIQWNEPFGIVFAESLASGTPVITCPRGATPEIIDDGRHGFLIEDIAAGVAAVSRLEEIDRRACRERALEAFDVPVIAHQYLAIYEELLA
ncbi:MAG: glycosyltransferase [Pseudomonadota bacterium]